ncbi:MAG: hypothetical protein J7M17_00640, partial [Anaerolineae bacterium]|nr:hypothetical protein [Anaerolineae bacterium]
RFYSADRYHFYVPKIVLVPEITLNLSLVTGDRGRTAANPDLCPEWVVVGCFDTGQSCVGCTAGAGVWCLKWARITLSAVID